MHERLVPKSATSYRAHIVGVTVGWTASSSIGGSIVDSVFQRPLSVRRFVRIPGRVRRAPQRCQRVARALVADPVETLLYAPEVLVRQFDRSVAYDVEEEWGPAFHRLLGLPWPCPELDECR